MVQLLNNTIINSSIMNNNNIYSSFTTEIINNTTGAKIYIPDTFHNISVTFKEGTSSIKVGESSALTFNEVETYELTYPHLNTQEIIITPITNSVIYVTYQSI